VSVYTYTVYVICGEQIFCGYLISDYKVLVILDLGLLCIKCVKLQLQTRGWSWSI